MPEWPDVTVYVEHLSRRLVGSSVLDVSVRGPNLLRTARPASWTTPSADACSPSPAWASESSSRFRAIGFSSCT